MGIQVGRKAAEETATTRTKRDSEREREEREREREEREREREREREGGREGGRGGRGRGRVAGLMFVAGLYQPRHWRSKRWLHVRSMSIGRLAQEEQVLVP